MISINNSKPWNIKPPTLYRYENENHIQDFFRYGKLRLSSFKNYRNYLDNALGDEGEGKTLYMQIDSIGLFREDGWNAYTFCTSLKHDEDLKKEFKRDACFYHLVAITTSNPSTTQSVVAPTANNPVQ